MALAMCLHRIGGFPQNLAFRHRRKSEWFFSSLANGLWMNSVVERAQRHKPGRAKASLIQLQILERQPAAFSLLDGALQLHSSLVDAVFLNDLAVMEHVELFSGVLASKHHDRLLPARVLTLQRINTILAELSVGQLGAKSARSTRPQDK